MNKSKLTILLIILILLFTSSIIYAQETKTLMGPDTKISSLWGINLKTGSIQDDVGVGYDVFYGALFNRSILLGGIAGMNITHPLINYGYLGLLGQYTHNPDEVIHFSGQLALGAGSAKGYEAAKSSAFDNFGNITGPRFFFLEPGVNVEFNLTTKTRLVIGISYRYVTGFDGETFVQEDYETDDRKEYSFSDTDLTTLNFNIGVKIGKY
ncbi:hypothetical protein ACFL5D_01930 [Candidatus Neomarinimicrobiota bacterium]